MQKENLEELGLRLRSDKVLVLEKGQGAISQMVMTAFFLAAFVGAQALCIWTSVVIPNAGSIVGAVLLCIPVFILITNLIHAISIYQKQETIYLFESDGNRYAYSEGKVLKKFEGVNCKTVLKKGKYKNYETPEQEYKPRYYSRTSGRSWQFFYSKYVNVLTLEGLQSFECKFIGKDKNTVKFKTEYAKISYQYNDKGVIDRFKIKAVEYAGLLQNSYFLPVFYFMNGHGLRGAAFRFKIVAEKDRVILPEILKQAWQQTGCTLPAEKVEYR